MTKRKADRYAQRAQNTTRAAIMRASNALRAGSNQRIVAELWQHEIDWRELKERNLGLVFKILNPGAAKLQIQFTLG